MGSDRSDGSDYQAVVESRRDVQPGSVLRLWLVPGGGFAAIISESKPRH